MIPSGRTVCEIDLQSLVSNFNWLSGLGSGFCCPMIKSNAYGHGAIPVARALESVGVKQLGVVFVEEAVELREAGIQTPLLIFGGIEPWSLELVEHYNLTPVVSSWRQMELLESYSYKKPVSIHVKVDTGMHRLGFDIADAQALLDRLWKNKKLRLSGLMTHLSDGEDLAGQSGESHKQLRYFDEFCATFKVFKPVAHALASSSLLALHNKSSRSEEENHWYKSYGSRLGLSLYGVSPTQGVLQEMLKPVMRIYSHITTIRKIKAGESVSYGGTWRAKKEGYIGVVPFGYADGLPRRASNKIHFRIGSTQVDQVGTICMDYCMVDLGVESKEQAEGFLNKEVIIFDGMGELPGIIPLAKAADTIPYEIMVNLGERVQRRFIGEKNA